MSLLRPACPRGRENRAGQGRRAKFMPEGMDEPEDAGPAKVCSVIRGCGGRRRLISLELLAGLAREAHAAAVLALDPHARRIARLRVEQHDIGDVDRAFLLDHAAAHLALALGVAERARALVALLDVHALDEHAVLLRLHVQDATRLALVLAGDDLDHVVPADLGSVGHRHSTSGASETIFMKFRSRSSRATGPKMRVPRGLFCGSMSTAAFSSKAMDVPSFRGCAFFVRTTTAFTTSPFLTAPCGVAALTVPTMMSPTPA